MDAKQSVIKGLHCIRKRMIARRNFLKKKRCDKSGVQTHYLNELRPIK